MGRHKIFQKHDLPGGIVAIAVAVIADYDRRCREIKKGTLPTPLLSTYQSYNKIVEEALSHVEEPARAEFISDISAGRGHKHSFLYGRYTSWSYYARKRDIIFYTAVGLGLAEAE